MSKIFTALISGIINMLREHVVNYKKNKASKRRGGRIETYLDKNFIFNYLPKFLSIEKVIQDFGKPDKKIKGSVELSSNDETRNITIYHYEFINAMVQFSTFENEPSVVSVTTSSTLNKSYPVKVGSIFDNNKDICFGEAMINKEILKNQINFESHLFTNWGYAAVQAQFFYKEIKGLTFTYVVHDLVESAKDMLNKKIDQLCISVDPDVYSVIYYYDIKHPVNK